MRVRLPLHLHIQEGFLGFPCVRIPFPMDLVTSHAPEARAQCPAAVLLLGWLALGAHVENVALCQGQRHKIPLERRRRAVLKRPHSTKGILSLSAQMMQGTALARERWASGVLAGASSPVPAAAVPILLKPASADPGLGLSSGACPALFPSQPYHILAFGPFLFYLGLEYGIRLLDTLEITPPPGIFSPSAIGYPVPSTLLC